jgi:molecular chaperone DnaK (HSP70)
MRVVPICLLTSLAFGAGTAHGTRPASLQVEARSPAVAGGTLIQDIGIDLGGVFKVLLERHRAVPCEMTQTFSTAVDNQTEITFRLFRGVAKLTRHARLLGRFTITDVPPAPRETVTVDVTISVGSDGSISLAAKETAGHAVQLRRRDG